MKITFTLCFIILSVALISCKKDTTELPPATETGANTFGCKIDGTVWVPAGFGIVSTAPQLESRFAGNSLFINARNFASSPTESEFEIYINNLTGTGTYVLNTAATYPTDLTSSYGYYVLRQLTPGNEWITSSSYTGTVTITKIDNVNNFVSGTFQFKAINLYNAPQPISITEGRFDVKTE